MLPTLAAPPVEPASLPPPRPHPAATAARVTVSARLRHILRKDGTRRGVQTGPSMGIVRRVSSSRHFRQKTGEEQRATWVELFFDLVFVFAITQLSALLITDTLDGAAADPLPAARRVVGLDLHDVDDELVRPGAPCRCGSC